MRLRITMLMVLALVAAACGGDGGASTTTTKATTTTTTTEAPPTTMGRDGDLFEAVTMSIDTEVSEGDLPLDRSEAECIAAETFDRIGDARWNEIGIATGADIPGFSDIDDNFTDTEWAIMIEGLFACVDVEAKLVDSLVESEIPQEVAECAAQRIAESGALLALISSRTGSEPEAAAAFTEFQETVAACAG